MAIDSRCTRSVPHENIVNLSEVSKFADRNLLAFFALIVLEQCWTLLL